MSAGLPAGVEVVGGDLADPSTLGPAVDGVTAAFVFAGEPGHVSTADAHNGRRYRLTGAESLTHAEQIALIGKGVGRRLRYEEVSPREARETMGLPPFLADPLFELWERQVGRPAQVTDAVERVTGRPARRYVDWVADHAADFQ